MCGMLVRQGREWGRGPRGGLGRKRKPKFGVCRGTWWARGTAVGLIGGKKKSGGSFPEKGDGEHEGGSAQEEGTVDGGVRAQKSCKVGGLKCTTLENGGNCTQTPDGPGSKKNQLKPPEKRGTVS